MDIEARLSRVATLAEDPYEPQNLEGLTRALGDPEWRVRKAASAVFLGMVCDQRLVDSLIGCLSSQDNAGMRNSAVEILVQLGEAAVPFLLKSLKDPDAEIRKFVVDILGEIKDRRAVEALVPILSDRDENVRLAAIEALGKIRDESVRERLLSILFQADNTLIQYAVLKALCGLGAIADLGPLVALRHKAPLERAVLEVLGHQGHLGALDPILEAIIEGRKKIRDAACLALADLYDGLAPGDQVEFSDRLRRRIGPELTQALAANLADEDSDLRLASVRILGWLGDPSAVRDLVRCLDDTVRKEVTEALVAIGEPAVAPLIECLRQADEAVREAIAQVFGEIASHQTVDILIEMLSDPAGHVRQAAARAVGKLPPDGRTVSALIRLFEDPYPNVQEAAVEALSNFDMPGLDQRLIEMLSNGDRNRRVNAVLVLGHHRCSAALSKLVFMLKDPDPAVRKAAVEALGRFDRIDIQPIVILALGDESVSVRLSAIQVLSGRQEVDPEKHLEPLLNDENIWIRVAAIKALGRHRGPQVKAWLLRHLSDPSELVQIASLEALGRMRDPELASRILELGSSPNHDVKKAVVEAVGEIGDGRLAHFVSGYLDDPHWDVRVSAIQAIGKIGASQCLTVLERIARTDSDPMVRESAQKTIQQLRDR